jgi:RNA polymerase sigma-70 factor, ECF subfamily
VTAAYEELRPLLFSIAYRMLGSVSEAEDVVQETFLRFHRAVDEVESPKAYLSTVATRLAIDHLRSARVRREQYVGPWLPEPLLTAEAEDDEDDETLSLAFLVVLETLSPVERAVFLLRDVFDFGYDEIAAIVERSEDNCRQLAVRARRRVEERRPRFETSREQRDELARRFFEAADAGDTDGLVSLLADDVVLYGDGGGKAPAAPYPIQGRERLSRVLVGFAKQNRRFGLRVRPAQVNGQPGATMVDADGAIVYVVGLDVADGLVQAVRSIVNPDKLRHLRT